MARRLLALATCCTIGWTGLAAAQPHPEACTPAVVRGVGEHFRLARFVFPREGMSAGVDDGGRLIAGACRPWPEDRALVAAAFAYEDDREFEKPLLVALVGRTSGRVIAAHAGVIAVDPASEVHPGSLAIDLAPYHLAPGVRAFGVRRHVFKDRCGYEGGADDHLALYVREGDALRPVLDVPTLHWRHLPGNRCAGIEPGRVVGQVLVAVGRGTTNGLADLELVTRRSDASRPLRVRLRYDGRRYEDAQWTKAFYGWFY